jgi:thiamine biosynthesis lipoprotein
VDVLKISPKIKQIVIVLFVLGPVVGRAPRPAAPAHGPELLRLVKTAEAMGSTYSVELYGYDRAKLTEAAEAALEEARRLDDLLSNYKPESEWSRINRHAAEGPCGFRPNVPPAFRVRRSTAAKARARSTFRSGRLMKVWGFYKGTGHLPHRAEVAAALTRVGYRHIHLDPAAGTVWFDRPGVEMDPGGIGKGYAVDRMVDVLKQNGVKIALVAGPAAVSMEWERRRARPGAGPSISAIRGTTKRRRRWFS